MAQTLECRRPNCNHLDHDEKARARARARFRWSLITDDPRVPEDLRGGFYASTEDEALKTLEWITNEVVGKPINAEIIDRWNPQHRKVFSSSPLDNGTA
jgi:hypothetical protein